MQPAMAVTSISKGHVVFISLFLLAIPTGEVSNSQLLHKTFLDHHSVQAVGQSNLRINCQKLVL